MDELAGSPRAITLTGPLTIGTAALLREQLLEPLTEGLGLRVDCSAATEADITFVQLLVAASRSAAERNLPFALSTPLPEAVADVLARSGVAMSAVGDSTVLNPDTEAAR